MARRGSEKRQRTKMLSVRFNEQEADALRSLADRAGLSVSSLMRRALLNTPPPRAARRPTVNHKAVAQLLGQLGKIGTNINQLAKQANAGRFQANSIELAMQDLMELRTACLQALGREPDSPPDDQD
ncbi:MAG: plasmid mobilization relaxosome protein MobC [Nitrospira sp.]|nr:plasmid mobilization relaxosome protein MobC [Nitrospira sp.]